VVLCGAVERFAQGSGRGASVGVDPDWVGRGGIGLQAGEIGAFGVRFGDVHHAADGVLSDLSTLVPPAGLRGWFLVVDFYRDLDWPSVGAGDDDRPARRESRGQSSTSLASLGSGISSAVSTSTYWPSRAMTSALLRCTKAAVTGDRQRHPSSSSGRSYKL
jgi:hypothetical protein